MPRLLLLRHAKSSWGEPGLKDIERPLAPRGRRNAAAMAKTIATMGLVPDRIVCSPAVRTRETLDALRPYLDGEDRITIDPELYDSSAEAYLGAIARFGGDVATVMLIGHNPSVHDAARLLVGEGERGLVAELGAKYPTGALAVIDFLADAWPHLAPRSGLLAAFIKPRDIDPGGPNEDDD